MWSRFSAALLTGTLMLALAARAEEPARLPLAFKGMELYSWRDAETQTWRYSLLFGTNRNKLLKEIKDPSQQIDSIDLLKQRLVTLAPGESVFWLDNAGDGFPDARIVAEINDAARDAGVDLICSCLPGR